MNRFASPRQHPAGDARRTSPVFAAVLIASLVAFGCDGDSGEGGSGGGADAVRDDAPLEPGVQGAIDAASVHFSSLGLDPTAGRIVVLESPESYDVAISFETERGRFGDEEHAVVAKSDGRILETYRTH